MRDRDPAAVPVQAMFLFQTRGEDLMTISGNVSKLRLFYGVLAIAVLCTVPSVFGQATYEPAQWAGLHYRNVGPWRGGRVTAVTGVPSEPYTFYMGTVGGGVWKTTDAGHTWVPMTDGQISVGPVGAVEVSQSNPKVIYAGTGSSKIRSNISIGRGIYKSVDAGKTWTFMGLRDVGQIATIRVDPGNADVVFVAASGNPFVPNKERGVYRSNDGGKTWKQVLVFVGQAGCGGSGAAAGASERGVCFYVVRAEEALDDHQRKYRWRDL